MLPSIHLIVSLILVIILFPFFGFYSLLIFIGGVLIDIDHIIFYQAKFKRFNFNKAYNYYRNIALKKDVKEYKTVFKIFHSLEFIILIVMLSFYHKIFAVLLIGLIAHLILDIIYEYPKFKSLEVYSLIGYLKNAKKQNK